MELLHTSTCKASIHSFIHYDAKKLYCYNYCYCTGTTVLYVGLYVISHDIIIPLGIFLISS